MASRRRCRSRRQIHEFPGSIRLDAISECGRPILNDRSYLRWLAVAATDPVGSSVLVSMVLDAVGHGRGRDVLPLVVDSRRESKCAQIPADTIQSHLYKEARQH